MTAETDRRGRFWRFSLALVALAFPLAVTGSILAALHVAAPEAYVLANDPSHIYYVIPGSGAEAAGLRADDVILSLNGRPFDADKLPAAIQNLRVGQSAAFTIRRPGGEQLDLTVPLVPVAQVTGYDIFRNTVIALIFWSAGVRMLWRYRQQKEVRLLALLAQALAVGLILPPVPVIIWYHTALAWVNVSGTACLFGVALLFHFHISFPARLGNARQRQWVLWSLYGATLAVAVVWIMGNYGWLPYGASLVAAVYGVLVIAGTMVALLYIYLRRATPDGRRRLRVILLGNLVAGGSTAFLNLASFVTVGYPLISNVWLVLCLAIGLLAYGYATMRLNLFGLDRLFNRALVYVLIALGIFLLYLGPLLLLDRLVPYDWLRHTLMMASLTLLVALAFEATRSRVQRWVDQLFYGGWYDFAGVVEPVSGALARCLDWEQLVEVLTRQAPAMMQLRGAQLKVNEQTTLPLEATLQPQLRLQLGQRGEWIVGPRRDGDELSATDERILKTLARQAEITLSNVLLVQTLRRQLDEILASRKSLTHLQRQLLRMREEERARLARDLHDGPIQTLVSLNMQLGLFASPSETGQAQPAVAKAIGDMRAEVRVLLSDLRQVCAELRPPVLDTLGLGAALRALAQDWSAQHSIAIHLDLASDTTLQSLPDEAAVNLYRIAQEALTNIARHASARQVRLCLAWDAPAARLSFVIQDDGQGFTPTAIPQPAEHGHFGLAAMQERAALIGGEWKLETAPTQGTKISVIWQPTNPPTV